MFYLLEFLYFKIVDVVWYFIIVDVVWYFRCFLYNLGNGDDCFYFVIVDVDIGGGICYVWLF